MHMPGNPVPFTSIDTKFMAEMNKRNIHLGIGS